MTIVQSSGGGAGSRRSSSSLADVIDTILDKGIVIDAYIRVSLVGIELLTIDVRIVVASVDTYLRFAEAVNRLDLTQTGGKGLPEVMEGMTQGVSKSKTKGVTQGAVEAAGEKLRELIGDSDGHDEDHEPVPRRRRRREE
ncbi:gas vesicle structural protein GvpA [Streptosporangium sp. NBC_01639]|uniref:gas vesicle protein GvpJ n=1 Tax=unclassified Streptosporangium TaxID=2632669 RepID=UPI002DD8B975|nr:gas vesicle protein GvpJ [Streptosporangium sp. NBC_01756]WSC87919.1 gas vesicle structural protein GvpA [Streptosporangium sp. NBC_01756]WTD53381.1 gas vesicle structural protein GvpA [Streptosporangium sp. NBC_01639]